MTCGNKAKVKAKGCKMCPLGS